MTEEESKYFDLLKNEVVKTFRQTYPGASVRMEDWKGETITLFQDELLDKVKEHISEKWFYNHIKSKGKHLPRIDMLNLLCKYCGFADWQDFTYKNQVAVQPSLPVDKSNRVFIIVPLLVIILLIGSYLLYKQLSHKEYQFCFVRADDFSDITEQPVQLEILNSGESSRTYNSDSSGCLSLMTSITKIRFVVSSRYYKTDTIVRVLDKFDRKEIVKLQTDDYALMLHYFSYSNVEAWHKRREQLDEMFADDAIIYEVFKHSKIGMEMYEKWEFIDKLTLPSKTLKQIEVLNMEYADGKIVKLRFSHQNQNEKI